MIVVFSHVHPAISKGGAEVAAHTLYSGLRRLGLPTAFVAMCPADKLDKVPLAHETEYLVPYRPERYDSLFHISPISVAQDVLTLLRRLQPTALVFHHFLNLGINTVERVAAAYPSVPSALVLHEFLSMCHHHGQMVTHPSKTLCKAASPNRCAACFPELSADDFHVRARVFQQAMAKLSVLISPSHFLAQRFVEWGIPASKLKVIENGLVHSGGDGASGRAGTSGAWWYRLWSAAPRVTGRPVFGYFGQINPFKGVNVLLDAAEILESQGAPLRIRLHGNLIGLDDKFQQRFDAAIDRGQVLEYAGPYQNSDVLRLMQQTSHVVMASTWWENSPVVIQEAFAARRPLVVPALGGMAEKVVNGVSGRHFQPGDGADLARVLTECVRHPRRYQVPVPSTAQEMATHYLQAMGWGIEPASTASLPLTAPHGGAAVPPPVSHAASEAAARSPSDPSLSPSLTSST
jgi:glycosyltransferase involved in cell wall biosynthesis